MTTVAVTGASGFVGSWVCAELVARGHRVLGGAKDAPATPVDGVEYEIGDLADRRMVHTLVEDAEAVIHLAAKAGGIRLQNAEHFEVFRTNRALTDALVSELSASVARLFLASSAVVYRPSSGRLRETDSVVELSDRPSGYAWSKVCDEVVARWLPPRVGVVIGRMTNVYGPGGSGRGTVIHDLIGRASRLGEHEELSVWGDGSAVRSFIEVSDAARLIVDLALGEETGTFNIDSEEPVSISDLASMVVESAAPGHRLAFDESMPSGDPHRVLDISKARSIGFTPKVRLAEGIRRCINSEARKVSPQEFV